MKQRIFVAIPVSQDLAREIETWQKEHSEIHTRFIEAKNLHLTIIPPWYADPKKVITQLKTFRSTIKPFDLSFDTIEPRERLVWVQGKQSSELTKLQKNLANHLALKIEKRPLLPHITLARARRMEHIPQESVNWTLSVESFVLMQSQLSPKGANYEVVAEFPLPLS